MNIVRHDPWNVFERLNRELNQLARQYGAPDSDAGVGDDSHVLTSRWTPAVDIQEESDRYVLVADIPGVDPKDIEVTMENNVLTIKGERKDERVVEDSDKRPGYRRVERIQGSFYRRFSLPDGVDAENISAKGEHGVLTISLPKKDQVQPRRISVAA
ncbi:MAG: Hsp20/alpha crystallin family protein [Candidatus Competibacterales bacterium]|nr:Hsp20/alpha crystallin family protein [Candidatus Competibacterales bacterium]